MKKLVFFLMLLEIPFVTHAKDVEQELTGTWQLVSMQKQEPSNKWVDRCFSPTGLLTYTADGYMSVGINCKKSKDSQELSTEMKDTIFYTGRYSVSGHEVTHYVVNSSDPVFLGKELKRTVQFNKDGTIALEGKGKSALVKLVWKRISK